MYVIVPDARHGPAEHASGPRVAQQVIQTQARSLEARVERLRQRWARRDELPKDERKALKRELRAVTEQVGIVRRYIDTHPEIGPVEFRFRA